MFNFAETGEIIRICKIGDGVVVECKNGFFNQRSEPVTEPENWFEKVSAYYTAAMHDHVASR
jgi:hypothetical protein